MERTTIKGSRLGILTRGLLSAFPSARRRGITSCSRVSLEKIALPGGVAVPAPISLGSSAVSRISLNVDLNAPIYRVGLYLSFNGRCLTA